MEAYVIYFDTSDHPDVYCVRKFNITGRKLKAGELLGIATDLQGARDLVPEGHIPFRRNDADDEKIIETWM